MSSEHPRLSCIYEVRPACQPKKKGPGRSFWKRLGTKCRNLVPWLHQTTQLDTTRIRTVRQSVDFRELSESGFLFFSVSLTLINNLSRATRNTPRIDYGHSEVSGQVLRTWCRLGDVIDWQLGDGRARSSHSRLRPNMNNDLVIFVYVVLIWIVSRRRLPAPLWAANKGLTFT